MLRVRKSIAKIGLIGCLLTHAFSSMALTYKQREELYSQGTITVFDEEGKPSGHYEVAYIPGTENIYSDQKAAWKGSSKLMSELSTENFWEEAVLGELVNGLDMMPKYIEDKGIVKIKQSYNRTKEKNQQTEGMCAVFTKSFNWSKFFTKSTLRAGRGIAAIPLGVTYALVVPTKNILTVPALAGFRAATTGTIVPAIRYVWNGATWAARSPFDAPGQDSLLVTYIPNYN